MSLIDSENQFFPVGINLEQEPNTVFEEDESVNEGQLAVDVVETDTDLVILATMAGALPGEVELFLREDLLTIRGRRNFPVEKSVHNHYRECYWGKFSRTVVLPVDVRADLARAEYRHGLLSIILPKAIGNTNIPIFVVEE